MKANSTPTKTVLVPFTGLVSMQSPSIQEKAEIIASLQGESASIASGEYSLFDKETFLADLRDEYRDYLRSK